MTGLNWQHWSSYASATISKLVTRLEAFDRLFLDRIDRDEFIAEASQRAGLLAFELWAKLEQLPADQRAEITERNIVCTACRFAVRMGQSARWIADRPIKPRRIRTEAEEIDLDAFVDDNSYSEADYDQFGLALECWIESRREDNGLGYSIWMLKEQGYAVFEAAHKLGVGKSKAYEVLKEFENSLETFASEYASFVL